MGSGFAKNSLYDVSKAPKRKTPFEKAREAAESKNTPWTLPEAVWEKLVYRDQCEICQTSARRRGNYLWFGEPSKGYTSLNCHPLCKPCYEGCTDRGFESYAQQISIQTGIRGLSYVRRPMDFQAFKRNCINRNLELTLSQTEFDALCNDPCLYCGTGKGESGFGIDRVDNTKGYTPENSVPCCWPCNCQKFTSTREDFIDRCYKIISRWESGVSKTSPVARATGLAPPPAAVVREGDFFKS